MSKEVANYRMLKREALLFINVGIMPSCEKCCCLMRMLAVRHSTLKWTASCIPGIYVLDTRVFWYWLCSIWCLMFLCLKVPWIHKVNEADFRNVLWK